MFELIGNILIISHVIHYHWQNRLWAYGPYAREIELWADLFPYVMIASPLRNQQPPADCLSFEHQNIQISPQPERGGNTFRQKLLQILSLPDMVWKLCVAMRQADAIQVRCPGNLGLLGVILAPLFTRYRISKYAGQWNGYQGEPFSDKLQRFILSTRWWNCPVLVYGNWPNQPPHVKPFFTSMMSASQTAHAREVAQQKEFSNPLRVLFSGRLVPEKRVDVLIEGISLVVNQGYQVDVTIVGDGPLYTKLQNQVSHLGLTNIVHFVGALPYEDAIRWNEWADCLVLPSKHSEGWPKVVAEAMSYGVVAIAVNHGQVGEMLVNRGILMEQGSSIEIAQSIIAVVMNKEGFLKISHKASEWAGRYSRETMRDGIRNILQKSWEVTI